MNLSQQAGGYSGTAYDRWVEQHNHDTSNKSTLAKVQRHYWVTKETVFRKLGKKEDDCVVACDAELDAKLELFHSIQDSCLDLQRIIDKYQERLCNLSQEESAMGRFLKDAGKNDKTHAGKMMSSVGKSLCYSGQQRLTLRLPLLRLYQEVDTFRHRAIEDTLQNVNSMEKVRTEYRASLSWMKNISQELDPDTHKQLEKFRKVQSQVRRSKVQFDQLKLDCLQKVDLLAAARCNMFSHALILYQKTLLQYAEKTHKTFRTVADGFKGYQQYEFNFVKELAEASEKLPEDDASALTNEGEDDTEQKDRLLYFDPEYKDAEEEDKKKTENKNQLKSDSLENMFNQQEILLDLGVESQSTPSIIQEDVNESQSPLPQTAEDFLLLDEIFQPNVESSFGTQWDQVFNNPTKDDDLFLPTQMLEQFSVFQSSKDQVKEEMSLPVTPQPTGSKSVSSLNSQPSLKNKAQDKRVAWFNLFADLDPLADPDAVGRNKGSEEDRKC